MATIDWRTHPIFTHIEISSDGRVRTKDRTIKHPKTGKRFIKGQILKPQIGVGGYVYTSFWVNGKMYNKRVSRLAAEAFFGLSDLVVNHIDSNVTNNNITNLEFVTQSENIKHAYKQGKFTHHKNRKWHPLRKVFSNDFAKIRRLHKEGMSQRKIASLYGCSHTVILRVIHGKNR